MAHKTWPQRFDLLHNFILEPIPVEAILQ